MRRFARRRDTRPPLPLELAPAFLWLLAAIIAAAVVGVAGPLLFPNF